MRTLFLLFLLLSLFAVNAQKQVATSAQTWLGYIQQVRLSQRWGLTADVHFRTADSLVRDKNLSLGRVGAVYFISETTQLSAGYAYFHYYKSENHPLTDRPEQRLWQQVLWSKNFPKLRVQNRFRAEQRWRKNIGPDGLTTDKYDFNWRARMQLQLLHPIGKKAFAPGSVALMLADEVMLNFGKGIVFNTFDQNRVIAGIQWQTGKNGMLQAGYMHIFQQLSGARYRQSHVARIFYTHVIDLRRKMD